MKSMWCLGPEAYVSTRYFESYVNKEEAGAMAPAWRREGFA